MDVFWVKAIKTTGAVGIVSFLLYTVLHYVFSDKIVAIFGSDRLFAITFATIISLLLILPISILWTKQSSSRKSTAQPKVKVVYGDQSTHNGDNNF